MSALYIVSTPIGNLKDISFRAVETLKEVDLILCEDTRVTKKLLDYYNIKTPTLSYHQHSRLKKISHILELLKSGKNLALVSDAGTPTISDPGSKLINLAIEQYDNITIVSVPGPSAVIAAASISGFPMDKFIFLGYPPTKKKRKKFFQEIADSKHPVIFYESPHRIIKSLRDLHETDPGTINPSDLSTGRSTKSRTRVAYGDTVRDRQNMKQTRKVIVCRELTKKFESIYRGTIDEVIQKVKKDPVKGEYTVVVGQK